MNIHLSNILCIFIESEVGTPILSLQSVLAGSNPPECPLREASIEFFRYHLYVGFMVIDSNSRTKVFQLSEQSFSIYGTKLLNRRNNVTQLSERYNSIVAKV